MEQQVGGDCLSYSNLKIYSKLESLRLRMYPRLVNFPKSEKFALSQDIRRDLTHTIRCVILADRVKSKRRIYASEAEGYLITVQSNLKLARDLRYVSKGFFKELDLEISVIKNMLSAYIKS